MRVISQNRNYSVNFDSVIFCRNYEVIYVKAGDDCLTFGKYESEERAAEVFQDIHNAYAPVDMITTNLSEEQCKQFIGSDNVSVKIIAMNEPDIGITMFDNYLYYMPEE